MVARSSGQGTPNGTVTPEVDACFLTSVLLNISFKSSLFAWSEGYVVIVLVSTS